MFDKLAFRFIDSKSMTFFTVAIVVIKVIMSTLSWENYL